MSFVKFSKYCSDFLQKIDRVRNKKHVNLRQKAYKNVFSDARMPHVRDFLSIFAAEFREIIPANSY